MNNNTETAMLKADIDNADIDVTHKGYMQTIKVIYKMQFGHKFYPNNNSAELVLKLMKQNCFTEEQLKILKTLGFTVEIETPQFELKEEPIKAKPKKGKS
jgi:hypothetical protein